MAGMIRIHRSLVETAAEELDTIAYELQQAHAPDGVWQDDDTDAKDTYDFYLNLIARLHEALA